VSLQTCCWWAEKLPDNVTCGEGCPEFPACLPTLGLVRKLLGWPAAVVVSMESLTDSSVTPRFSVSRLWPLQPLARHPVERVCGEVPKRATE
jgi:hypothetical protein